MRTKVAAAIVLVACALGACGDEDNEARSKDEKQIHATLNEALISNDPDSCIRFVTQRFLEQSTAERGVAALLACRKEVAGQRKGNSDSVSIGRVAVSGPRASADVRLKGSRLFFKTLRLGLRKPAGHWQVDRVKTATLNRPAFFRFARKELRAPPDALSDRDADCVLRRFKRIENATIVRSLLKVDLRLFLIEGAICGLGNAFAGTGAPPSLVACAQRRLRRELTSGSIGRKVRANPARVDAVLDSPRTTRKARRVIAGCARP